MTPHQHVARCLGDGRVPGDNPGLLLQRLAPPLNGEPYRRFICALADTRLPPSYSKAFRRWQRRTPPGVPWRRVIRLRTEGLVLVGLGEAAPGENGLTTSYPWGAPTIPGSALKGAVRALCNQRFPDGDPWGPGGEALEILLGAGGHEGQAGAVDFLDAWIEPDGRFADDVLTPHHADYYRGQAPPRGWEGPNPVTFAGARGHFRVVLEGSGAWLDRAEVLLLDALRILGVGGKTRAGYGRLLKEAQLDASDRGLLRDEEAARERAQLLTKSATERLAHLLKVHKRRSQELQRALEQLVLGEDPGSRIPELRWEPRRLLDTSEPEVQAVLHAHLRGGIARRARKKGSERSAQILAILDRWCPEQPTGGEPTGDKEPQHLSASDLVLRGKEKKPGRQRDRKIQSLARRLRSGGYALEDVQRALEILAEWGAKAGTRNTVRRAYGMEEEPP
ncbi:MAG TPA: type III-B CRISPR module RAMP protein Cmr6 [Deltaproteobacteria bacterium]|nr:type III-B CRISPR module RAMP protein Cmr6 [Deltaproteobacteria bacterium]